MPTENARLFKATHRIAKPGLSQLIEVMLLDDGVGNGTAYTREQWVALQQALDDPAPFHATLRRAAEMGELKPQLRTLLHYHCGVSTLRTRQMMMDLQSL